MAKISDIQQEIINSIQTGFNENEFLAIFGNTTAPQVRPNVPYVSIKYDDMQVQGSKPYIKYANTSTDGVLNETVVDTVNLTFSCNFYRGEAFDNALLAQQILRKSVTQEYLSTVDSTYTDVSNIKDYTVPVGTSYEHRAWFTLTVSSCISYEDEIPTLDSLSINGKAIMPEVTEYITLEV